VTALSTGTPNLTARLPGTAAQARDSIKLCVWSHLVQVCQKSSVEGAAFNRRRVRLPGAADGRDQPGHCRRSFQVQRKATILFGAEGGSKLQCESEREGRHVSFVCLCE